MFALGQSGERKKFSWVTRGLLNVFLQAVAPLLPLLVLGVVAPLRGVAEGGQLGPQQAGEDRAVVDVVAP